MTFFAGKNASCVWNATAQTAEKFDLDFSSEVVDTTNFSSAGYQENVAGVFACRGSCDGPYNGSLGITQGELLTITWAVGGGGPSFALPMRNSSIKINTATHNQVARFAIALESSGVFTVTF